MNREVDREIEGRYRYELDRVVDEAIKEWDGLEGKLPPYPVFMQEAVYRKWVERFGLN